MSQAPLHNHDRHQIKLPNWRAFGLKNAFFSTLFYSFFCSGKKAMELTSASYQLCWLEDYVHGPLDLGSVLHEQLLTFVFWTRWSYADIVWSVVQTNHARVKTILTRFVPLRKDGCCCCYIWNSARVKFGHRRPAMDFDPLIWAKFFGSSLLAWYISRYYYGCKWKMISHVADMLGCAAFNLFPFESNVSFRHSLSMRSTRQKTLNDAMHAFFFICINFI